MLIKSFSTKNNTRFHVPTSGKSFANRQYCILWMPATLYIEMPESMLFDQGSVFIADEWHNACEINGIEITETVTEGRESLNVGETYHSYLLRIYFKLRHEISKLSPALLLFMTTKAVNDCAGQRGLVPSLLVFGFLPRLPSISKRENPAQVQHPCAANDARRE
eukprot:IDg12909t1